MRFVFCGSFGSTKSLYIICIIHAALEVKLGNGLITLPPKPCHIAL